MNSNVTVRQPRALDEFADWTDEVENHDDQMISERAIIGQLVRFGNDGKFRLRDNSELTKPLIVANCRRVLTKWGKEKRPVETIFLKAGEKIPDLKERNEKLPRSEWVPGFNNQPKGPWEAQHVVYMVDPVSIDQFTYPTATIGGGIAVRELVDRILWMRRFKGNAVYPVVQLATQPMSIQGGTAIRPRPHFEIVRWTKFETDAGNEIAANDPRQLPLQPPAEIAANVVADPASTGASETAPNAAKKMQEVLAAIGGENVEAPSAKEVTDDEIKF